MMIDIAFVTQLYTPEINRVAPATPTAISRERQRACRARAVRVWNKTVDTGTSRTSERRYGECAESRKRAAQGKGNAFLGGRTFHSPGRQLNVIVPPPKLH
ncbi:MAG: hypothetical protein M0P39_16000 [Rhodocyclaceae bacterium]|jgi:hypothetical protein|nr:hypothetical protein [Rhodocyclaceae bacterium]